MNMRQSSEWAWNFLRGKGWKPVGGEVWDSTDFGSWKNRTGLLLQALFPLGDRESSLAIWQTGRRAGPASEPEAAPSSMTVTPATTDEAIEFAPALSPDGRLLAFLREGERGYDLLVKQVGGGSALTVAQGVAEGAGLSWLYGGSALTWSPDGQEVAFIRHVPHPDGGVRPVIATRRVKKGARSASTRSRNSGVSQ